MSSISKELDLHSDAKAAVIGCSRNPIFCTKTLHPNDDDFVTIDINKKSNPHVNLDITTELLPELLKNRFVMTVLEYLPYDVYNDSKIFTQHNGEKGFKNIWEMTKDDGFIAIFGTTRDLMFRKCLAKLNYLEIAKSKDGVYVVLIAKDQRLNVEEVVKNFHNLPDNLLAGYKKKLELDNYRIINELSFCKSNYKITPKYANFIDSLSLYKEKRLFLEENYLKSLTLFGHHRCYFGYSKVEKTEAVDTLISVLLGNTSEKSLLKYENVLKNGRLGEIIKYHLGKHGIDRLISPVEKAQINRGDKRITLG
jgi:hypothetical protein